MRPATPMSLRRRCSPSSTAPPRSGRPIFDPEIELNFAMMVHGGQEFEWGPVVVAGDEITTTASVKDISEARRPRLLRLRVSLHQSARRAGLSRDVDQHRARSVSTMADLQAGTRFPRCAITPDKYPHGPLRRGLRGLQPDPHRRGVRSRGRAARTHPARSLEHGPGGARADRGRRWARAPQATRRAVPRHGLCPSRRCVVTGTVRERRRGTRDRSTPWPSRTASRSSATPRPS